MRCTLHIGTEKTGTTTLQRLLRTNRSSLAERGVIVPLALGPLEHHHLVSYGIRPGRFFSPLAREGVTTKAQTKTFQAELRAQFLKEMRDAPTDSHLVLSSERCFSVLAKESEIERTVSLLREVVEEVRVVVYLRPQHELCVSLYSTSLKNGFVLEEILPKDTSTMPHLDYSATLKRWEDVVGTGNIDVRLFNRKELLERDIGADFFKKSLGLEIEDFERVPNQNESLSIEAQLFLRELNEHLPRFDGKKLSTARANIGKLLEQASSGRGMLPTADEAGAFFAQFAASNAEVQEAWFPDRSSLFGVDFSRYPSEPIDYELKQADAFALFAELWRAKQAEVDKLKAKVDRKRAGGGKSTKPLSDKAKQSSQYRGAEDELAAGNAPLAIALLEANMAGSPKAAQSMYLLGIALCADGQIAEGRKRIDKALSLKPWVKDPAPNIVDLYQLGQEAAASDPEWEWAQYQKKLRELCSTGLTLKAAVDAATTKNETTVVQVGANDGISADPIREFILNRGWSGVLIEPLPEPFEALAHLYRERDGIEVENAAISDTDGHVSLWMNSGDTTTLASLRPERNALKKKSSLVQMEVRSITFESLFEKHGLTEIDVLQIDAEGYDAEVLRLFDLSRRPVSLVNLEFYCLTIEERLRVLTDLESAGLVWNFDGQDLLAVRESDVVNKRFAISRRSDAT